jgi:hypothetical protein
MNFKSCFFSDENNLGFHMRYHFFLHYRWFLISYIGEWTHFHIFTNLPLWTQNYSTITPLETAKSFFDAKKVFIAMTKKKKGNRLWETSFHILEAPTFVYDCAVVHGICLYVENYFLAHFIQLKRIKMHFIFPNGTSINDFTRFFTIWDL